MISWVRYFLRFSRLVVKAGSVWGVRVNPSLPMKEQGVDVLYRLLYTPLYMEAHELLIERERLRGLNARP